MTSPSIDLDPNPDWGAGVKLEPHLTSAGLKRSAMMALKEASKWADTAQDLLSKAAYLEGEGR